MASPTKTGALDLHLVGAHWLGGRKGIEGRVSH